MRKGVHVIFGAGQVGPHLASRLLAEGKSVRVVRRSAGAVAGAELVRGDAMDRAFCVEAAAAAKVIYHCMNPPYDRSQWARQVPVHLDNLIEAARRADARLVVLDNLYMLGSTGGVPMNEDTPMNPCSRKGEIRARAAERLAEAQRRGEVRAVTGRASDFYGPGGSLTHLGEHFWRPALAGKTGRVLVNPDVRHTYHYIPDVAAGLHALGRAENDVEGKVWMLPCAPGGTMRQLIEGFAHQLGRLLRVSGTPKALVKILGVFMPLVREIGEMLYQWDEPFIVDDRRFRERFAMGPERSGAAAAATVDWAMSSFGA